ncbi:hypothetical protein OUZ56_016950 [Daphnia magna]|uniref:Uncharacterized protein n=1 Tax=Daphnia magna TaxID=35525 RepID=A0ABR0ART0_9CRUS|nr:hypothetical protein OUZ56_016950 [Daphnia magna]
MAAPLKKSLHSKSTLWRAGYFRRNKKYRSEYYGVIKTVESPKQDKLNDLSIRMSFTMYYQAITSKQTKS